MHHADHCSPFELLSLTVTEFFCLILVSIARDKQLDGPRRWLASSCWPAATQFALAVTLTSSRNDLVQLEIEDEYNILKKTKNAVITLQGVLEGKHDKDIQETLDQYQVSRDRRWSSFYKMVEGLAMMSKMAPDRPHQADSEFEDKAINWDRAEM
ncbi:hypothetical protein FXO38_15796 [Capsicum annuum]|nr:hypothetical protein FXO38_15796 [Capsicum annuum]